MSFHPHDVRRRAFAAAVLVLLPLILLGAAFFRTQVLEHEQFAVQSETNRLRPIPLPAPRAAIYDRHGRIIAESVPGYSVSLIAKNADSLRATLGRLAESIELDERQIEATVRRYTAMPSRPALVLADAQFDLVSVLEELRTDFPGLIIQASPKRYYPAGEAVSAFVGYTGEIAERELAQDEYADYKAGQQIGKDGLERTYENRLRGREGTRYVEVDARNRIVREQGARTEQPPETPEALMTNIDLDLQRYAASLFGDTLQGGVVVMDPHTGGVLALHSAPGYDPNRFIGGVSHSYYDSLQTDPRKPLYNKALKGRYEPASTFKLATAAIGLELGLVDMDTRMAQPCNGGYVIGGRRFKCWKRDGHGAVTLRQAIAGSCNVYFYQLGLRIGLRRLLAGGVALNMSERSGIDLFGENRPTFPESFAYYDRQFGEGNWVEGGRTLNLSIGQGENVQTITSMARFYSALATDGHAATPTVAQQAPRREKVLNLDDAQIAGLRTAMLDVVSSRGTAGSAALEGIQIAGKTGTAQNPRGNDHAWFVGFAPAEHPTIVVAVMIEYGQSGGVAARMASKVIGYHLKQPTAPIIVTDEIE